MRPALRASVAALLLRAGACAGPSNAHLDTEDATRSADAPDSSTAQGDALRPSDAEPDPAADTSAGDAPTELASDEATPPPDGASDGDTTPPPDGASDGAPSTPVLDALLEALRADRDAALRAQAYASGWPAPVEGGRLFVTADTSLGALAGSFNAWTPAAMIAEGDFAWRVEAVSDGDGYKFTDGTRWVADPWARRVRYDELGAMSVALESRAHLERWYSVGDGIVTARDLRVWVPAEPVSHVLYAHDGQNLFMTPDAILGGWRLDESAPPGMLIVGIENTPARYEDYGPHQDVAFGTVRGGGADAYAAFVRDTVRPLIRAAYGEPGPVGLMGSSMGGVISLYTALVQPGAWDFAASLSGALDWGSRTLANPTIVDLYRDAGRGATPIYLDSGGGATACVDADGDGLRDDDPTETDGYCVTIQMRDLLEANGYRFDVDLWHWHELGAAHNEPAWAARVFRPLELFAAM